MTLRFHVLRNLSFVAVRRQSEFPESRTSSSVKTRRAGLSLNALRYALLTAVFAASITASRIGLAQNPAQPAGGTSTEDSSSIPEAWPANVQMERLSDIGRGKAVIFSPDFAESGNREFYEKLGFLYIENASWQRALNEIVARNYWHPETRVETIFLETHGTNGNGLKLQTGPLRGAARSYISIGALQEKLEGQGVRLCVIGACNAGRLFRPEIYKTLDPQTRDPLFLPPTLGIINATKGYDPSGSKMIVVRRAESEIETTSDGDTSELSPEARAILKLDAARSLSGPRRALHFVVSNLLIQMLTHDPRLKLTSSGFANEKSRNDLSLDESDALFDRFLSYINDVAAREYRIAQGTISANAEQTASEPRSYNSRPSRAASLRAKKRPPRKVID